MIRLSIRMGTLLAVLFLGIVLGAYIYHDQASWIGGGKDAFLLHQNHRFDAMHPHLLMTMINCVFLVAIGIGFYEFVAWGFNKVLPKRLSDPS